MTLGKGGSAWWLTMPGAIDGGASTGLNGSWGDARGWTVSEDRWFSAWNKDLCLSEVW